MFLGEFLCVVVVAAAVIDVVGFVVAVVVAPAAANDDGDTRSFFHPVCGQPVPAAGLGWPQIPLTGTDEP